MTRNHLPPTSGSIESARPSEPTQLSRQGFLRAATLGIASTLITGPNAHAEQPHEEPPLTEHPALESEQNHESSSISLVNTLSALAVVGGFSKKIWDNAMNPKKPFGPRSIIEMTVLEGLRLGALATLGNKEDDKHQLHHEVKDLGVSYTLMGALVTIAEATEHIEADEKALFDNYAKVMDEAEQTELPDALTTTSEDWQSHYTASKEKVIKTIAENHAIGMTVAPIATTYTSATLVNAMNKRMAVALSEHAYAEAVHNAKQNGETLTEEKLAEYVTDALNTSDELMHGKDGYVLNTLTNGANIQGGALFGDPPNFFYIMRNGVSEWLKASKNGFMIMNGLAYANNVKWMSKALGIKDTVTAQMLFAKNVAGASKDLGKGMLQSIMHPDYSLLRFKKIETEFSKIVDQPDNTLGAEEIGKIRNLFTEMKTTPFAYDINGLLNAIPTFPERDKKEADKLASEIHSEHSKDGTLSDDLFDRIQADEKATHSNTFVSDMVDQYLGKEKNWQIDQLAKTLDAILTQKTPDESELAAMTNTLQDITGEQLDTERIDTMTEQLTDFIRKGDKEAADDILLQLSGSMTLLSKDRRKSIVEFWAKQIKADSVDDRTKERGLSHAASEVFTALATQIPAANAAAVSVRKLLELMGDKLPGLTEEQSFEVQNKIVMGFAAGLSGVADNVVAYVFCEDVLMSQYKKRYGADVFEKNPDLKSKISQDALLMAIGGGALTKIGNGPNFKFEKHIALFENGRFTTRSEELEFKDTLVNTKGLADVVAIGTVSHVLQPTVKQAA